MMERPEYGIAQIIQRFGADFVAQYHPNTFTLRTLDALQQCRTQTLGGHKDKCDNEACGKERFSYNSCGNRHCPKCQAAKQALWAEDRMNDALNVKYFHVVFTVPEALGAICLLDSRAFYSALFECAWSTLHTFGYSHYGVESGAICALHTWGQNIGLHPHLHCIVPAAGLTLGGKLKRITKNGKYLYPVKMLSTVFRGKLLGKLKLQLKKNDRLVQYQSTLDECWVKPWVVYCEPPLGNARQIVRYLGQYTHRVAISNKRIRNIDESGVTFLFKDYKDKAREKSMTLTGVEFLRRFCMHILPCRFVKIRYYGILGSRYKKEVEPLKQKPDLTKPIETRQQRIVRLIGFDPCKCPYCKTGTMRTVEELPKIRPPNNVLYPNLQKDMTA